MLITRKSMLSGNTRSREIDVTQEQINEWQQGALAQVAFGNLSADDREFIITGSTPEEWESAFSDNT